MRVLLAAEHPDLRLSIELLISQEAGVTFVGAASETQGLLALIQSTSPDIVILEWTLPGRPLADLLAKELIPHDQIKFIVLCNSPEVKKLARQAGVDACVIKGETPEQLLAVFRGVRKQISSMADESKTISKTSKE